MEQGLVEAQTAFAAALARGDAAGTAALYTAGARLLTPSSELLGGRLEIEAFCGRAWRSDSPASS